MVTSLKQVSFLTPDLNLANITRQVFNRYLIEVEVDCSLDKLKSAKLKDKETHKCTKFLDSIANNGMLRHTLCQVGKCNLLVLLKRKHLTKTINIR